MLSARTELEMRLVESQRQVETQTSTLQAHINQITDLSHRLRQSDEDKQTLSFKLNSMEKELAANKSQLNKVQLGGIMNNFFVLLSFTLYFV